MHKANLPTLGSGEGKYSIYGRAPNKGNGQLTLKKTELFMAFRQGFFSSFMGEGHRLRDQLMDLLLIGWH